MRLAALLEPTMVSADLKGDSKNAAINELMDLVIRQYPDLDRAGILSSIAEREEIENTSFGRCFAFPHARTDLVSDMHIAMGVSKKGIKAPTPDQKPLHVICLLLTPRNIAQLYLQTLSGLAALARDERNLPRLMGADSPEEVIRAVWDTGITIRKHLTVRDIMHRDVVSANPDESLKDAANKFYRYKVSGMPVIDNDGKPIGIISERHLIQAALPNYESLIQNMALAPDVEPFDELLRHEDEIKVRDIMTMRVFTTTEDTPIVEAAAQMLFRKIRRVPVVDSYGSMVGIILRRDIVSKVIRG
ncbi:MAG: CBS domain-containing protein [candidate division Zixibacteria bacterium]|nr:CBS domain-containing protein [candidate division Zixibacteria bacterium]